VENHSNVTVQYEGLDPIEGVASEAELAESFCMVHVTSNPNVGGDRTVGHWIAAPRSIIVRAEDTEADA